LKKKKVGPAGSLAYFLKKKKVGPSWSLAQASDPAGHKKGAVTV